MRRIQRCYCKVEVGRKEERKGSGKIMEEEWMDGSITGFTELTASQHSTAQHQQYCLLLGLGCLL